MQHYRILMRELENGVALGEPDLEIPSFGIDIACCGLMSYPLILLTHLARSHALYALILYSPIEHWILSLTTIINS